MLIYIKWACTLLATEILWTRQGNLTVCHKKVQHMPPKCRNMEVWSSRNGEKKSSTSNCTSVWSLSKCTFLHSITAYFKSPLTTNATKPKWISSSGHMHCMLWFLHAQTMGTLQDSLACSMFPAPRAFPTRTLAAAENPRGNCGKK